MEKLTGIHFYINIVNFSQIILEEEAETKRVTHSIHALDTFFSSIESFGKKTYPETLVVEKVTGSKLHLYVLDAVQPAFDAVRTVSVFARRLAGLINRQIPKYRSLPDFRIQVGAACGVFCISEFRLSEEVSEITSIGYAANFAAKLLGLSGPSSIAVSEQIYHSLSPEEREGYERIDSRELEKYGQTCFYRLPLASLKPAVSIESADLDSVKDYANSFHLSDIQLSEARVPVNFREISKTRCKKLSGIPVFSDIRGFTRRFSPDGSNLEAMSAKTQAVLRAMYEVTEACGGIHVQFQGDRELSLYHDLPERTVDGTPMPETRCFRQAVLAAMRMIDCVKPFRVHIGVGADYGLLFAAKIGARGEKDNILLGETVILADRMEDLNAEEDQLAVTREVYDGLREEDPFLAAQFQSAGTYYVASIGYEAYAKHPDRRDKTV